MTASAPPVPDKKDTNPKAAFAADKLPVHLWPASATALGCLALLDGALKYGRANWRFSGVRASTYRDALSRHMDLWFEGEDKDANSGLSHLGHALACLAILVDAEAANVLTDDRNFPGKFAKYAALLSPNVKRLREEHEAAGDNPMHFDIQALYG